ncbi:hypothetical protein IE81DRAFT_176932 [Ceraceosorus guamensis]|uniref:Uncharacterized protein n=1 Tax=Ceraceosorus guamensis TaxID=1522189 RepID=A0A316VVD9_9BASI|nr:hypothetical protein IE81DRAFT_176932 [Ceraceosorus guamensis]PWN41450.1 hypothetical protein IE81DRAFT_176932 [Ceraceosorus guamensis]
MPSSVCTWPPLMIHGSWSTKSPPRMMLVLGAARPVGSPTAVGRLTSWTLTSSKRTTAEATERPHSSSMRRHCSSRSYASFPSRVPGGSKLGCEAVRHFATRVCGICRVEVMGDGAYTVRTVLGLRTLGSRKQLIRLDVAGGEQGGGEPKSACACDFTR